jgi:predicted flavoprotein YhiN
VSGPAVLKLSAYGAVALHRQGYRAQLTINWLPHLAHDHLPQTLQAVKADQGKRPVCNFGPWPCPGGCGNTSLDNGPTCPPT